MEFSTRIMPRYAVKLSFIAVAQGQERSWRAGEISRGGMLALTLDKLPPSTPLIVKLRYGRETHTTSAHVVSQVPDGLAIAFEEPSEPFCRVVDAVIRATLDTSMHLR